MVRVMASGAFDIVHPGHIHFLKEARKLGDELFVVVASDTVVEKRKRKPVMDQASRLLVVSELKVVDKAVAGVEGDMFSTALAISPNIIALGYDQSFDDEKLKNDLFERGLTVEIVRISPLEGQLNGSRKIIGKVKEQFREEGS